MQTLAINILMLEVLVMRLNLLFFLIDSAEIKKAIWPSEAADDLTLN